MTTPLIFAVGSENPVKINCVTSAVAKFWSSYKVRGLKTDSGVAAQPQTESETFCGASNRARSALAQASEAHYGVGVEGGLTEDERGVWAFAVVVIVDRQERVSEGQTGRFRLPPGVLRLMREEGLELGDADDRFFGRENSKQQEGAIGILSDGEITRSDLYQPAVVFALLPFIHPEYYENF